MDILTSPLFLNQILQQSPLYLIWFIGIIIALVKWDKHPRLSLLVLLTLICFILQLLVNGAIIIAAPLISAENHWGVQQMVDFYTRVTFISSLVSAILWGLNLWAFFGWRKPVADPTNPT
ncbi:hypothetical protein [Ktedonospora formicarum]|uniref:Uncharacterized protein n=1 Tax=Ktedonospora formicarum TaxID=2778364 RepID=A0A8J3HX84_9CHLR|nr:hypothetical protein [Ktedonospora formicarum]GHO42258.1 hypothetical protein KSX_04210 [Ktedonospora formicarum]